MPAAPIFLLTLEGSVGVHKLFARLGGQLSQGLGQLRATGFPSTPLTEPKPKTSSWWWNKTTPTAVVGEDMQHAAPRPQDVLILGVKHLDFGLIHLFSLLCIYKEPSFI